jgi:hypothetical protein
MKDGVPKNAVLFSARLAMHDFEQQKRPECRLFRKAPRGRSAYPKGYSSPMSTLHRQCKQPICRCRAIVTHLKRLPDDILYVRLLPAPMLYCSPTDWMSPVRASKLPCVCQPTFRH